MARGKRRASQAWLTGHARGEDCQIRVPGLCNHDPETTVPCHYRLAGESGFGYLAPEHMIAFGCSACHAHCDSHHDAETKLMLAEAVFRTQSLLIGKGAL